MVCHFSFSYKFGNRIIDISKKTTIYDYFLPLSNFSLLSFVFLIKKSYLCDVILRNVDL